jgi:signal transduction histidine kinase
MQEAVDGMILEVRRGTTGSRVVDFSEVVSTRLVFWRVLAAEQERSVIEMVAAGPLMVRAATDEVGSVLDALIGNVMTHTPPGTPFEVRLNEDDGRAALIIGDAGPGFPPGLDPAWRGVSGAGSTGLGLDIARKLAEKTGGSMRLSRSPLGGAQIELKLDLESA